MHRNVIFTSGLIVYFLMAAIVGIALSFSLPTMVIILLGLPTMILARYSAACSILIWTVVSFAAGLTLLLEGVAHLYGLWSLHLTADPIIATSIVLALLLKTVFLVLFYELIFDDGVYQLLTIRRRFTEFILFAFGTLVLFGCFAFWFKTMSSSAGYYWLVLILFGASLSMLAVRQAVTLKLFRKIAVFAAVAAVPLLAVEAMLIGGGHKVIDQSLHLLSLPLINVSVPLGEILLVFALPALVVTVYELYLDDSQ